MQARRLLTLGFAPLLALAASWAGTDSIDQLEAESRLAQRHYDLAAAETLLPRYQAFLEQSPSDQARFGLARLALIIAQLKRTDYEMQGRIARDNRMLGREIDNAAEIGHRALRDAPEASEKWRIKADLWGTMIRSKYKGKKYGNEMMDAMDKALELDPDNPDALVTGSLRKLFAHERHGGDIPGAIKMLTRALEIDPELERALVFRGMAHEKNGDMVASTADIIRALELNPNSRLARENLNRFRPPDDWMNQVD